MVPVGEGILVGPAVFGAGVTGGLVGGFVGAAVGFLVGAAVVGFFVGARVGAAVVGFFVGAAVVGFFVGALVGLAVGLGDGLGVAGVLARRLRPAESPWLEDGDRARRTDKTAALHWTFIIFILC
jgi:hypothetical protein